ncbi:MAG: DUF4340 domain-containing protein [Proteobacteria bacterium]|nr:DUF4340 domain-containing protein [Pseudomonadota bacterium]
MTKWIPVLSAVLAAQLVLAVVVNLKGEEYGVFAADEKLLSFDRQSIDSLRIDDGTDSVVLIKRDGAWRLPGSGDFPASQQSVERLLDKLAALQKGWPVARTRGAARRFNVDREQFERKLALLSGADEKATLFVGSSPDFRKVYVRPGDEDEIFAVDFKPWEAEADADSWIDKDVLNLDASDVERVEMPGFILHRVDDVLQVADLGDEEQTDDAASRALLGKLTGLRIQSLLGTENKPEYGQDEPALEFKIIRVGGESLSYRFSKLQDTPYYVLRRSDLDYYLQVAEYWVDPVIEITREQLVQARSDAEAGESQDLERP